MYKYAFIIWICALLYRHISAEPQSGPIAQFVRTNLVGFPVIHEKQDWIFDPDVAKRRRKQFMELNGDKGERLIERLGLGIDGYEDYRLKMQRERDEGHLGGINAYLP